MAEQPEKFLELRLTGEGGIGSIVRYHDTRRASRHLTSRELIKYPDCTAG